MEAINSPIFVLTSDIDWASEDSIDDLVGILDRFSVKPVIMATHESAVIAGRAEAGQIELGLHPNFLPNSTHGTNVTEVIDHMFRLFPNATTFRSHSFVDSTAISREMTRRGIRYDSNLCLYMQSNLVPLQHESGMIRFPIFWEDDVHRYRGGSWHIQDVLEHFLTPGLKVLNVHPIWISMNIPDDEFYQAHRKAVRSLTRPEFERLRHRGAGARTFLIDLLTAITRMGHRFHTLADVYRLLSQLEEGAGEHGRSGRVSNEEYDRYWRMSDRERQDFLKEHYNRRAASDCYATSRDVNLRELEITAIAPFLPKFGRFVDLGCGNGYTLLSLAQQSAGDCEFVGVDFASNLIEGAKELCARASPRPRATPQFFCADAVAYVSGLASNSIDAFLTERFLLNLPSREAQLRVIRECHRALKPGGRLLMCEASAEGFEALNRLREACGLDAIPETGVDNVSAIRFREREIEEHVRQVGFRASEKLGFSQYFITSRVLHPLLVKPLPPRFDSPINRLARDIQANLPMHPGFGSNVLWVLEKS
jgi:SAM-dependent methyltransferase